MTRVMACAGEESRRMSIFDLVWFGLVLAHKIKVIRFDDAANAQTVAAGR